jgi:hypothetical protein
MTTAADQSWTTTFKPRIGTRQRRFCAPYGKDCELSGTVAFLPSPDPRGYEDDIIIEILDASRPPDHQAVISLALSPNGVLQCSSCDTVIRPELRTNPILGPGPHTFQCAVMGTACEVTVDGRDYFLGHLSGDRASRWLSFSLASESVYSRWTHLVWSIDPEALQLAIAPHATDGPTAAHPRQTQEIDDF